MKTLKEEIKEIALAQWEIGHYKSAVNGWYERDGASQLADQILALIRKRSPNKYNEYTGRKRGAIGIATNVSYMRGYNQALKEIKELLK